MNAVYQSAPRQTRKRVTVSRTFQGQAAAILGAMTRLAVLLILMLLSLTSAQGVQVREFAGVTHVSLQDVATVLGEAATRVGDSVTLRTPFGVLTLFSGSQDGFWRAAAGGAEVELRLALPLREDRGALWAPLSLLTQLGGTVSGRVVVLPDRTRLL